MEALARGGVKRIAVIKPRLHRRFRLETLEEIGGENAEIFHLHGGEKFAAIPCLNDTDEGMRVIENVVRRELSGGSRPDTPLSPLDGHRRRGGRAARLPAARAVS